MNNAPALLFLPFQSCHFVVVNFTVSYRANFTIFRHKRSSLKCWKTFRQKVQEKRDIFFYHLESCPFMYCTVRETLERLTTCRAARSVIREFSARVQRTHSLCLLALYNRVAAPVCDSEENALSCFAWRTYRDSKGPSTFDELETAGNFAPAPGREQGDTLCAVKRTSVALKRYLLKGFSSPRFRWDKNSIGDKLNLCITVGRTVLSSLVYNMVDNFSLLSMLQFCFWPRMVFCLIVNNIVVKMGKKWCTDEGNNMTNYFSNPVH